MNKSKIGLKFIARLIREVHDRGDPTVHTKVVSILGMPFTYEKMWFSSDPPNTERVKLYGRNWEIILEYVRGLVTTGSVQHGGVYIDIPGQGRKAITSYEIGNEEGLLRDLAFMRTAGGFDHLFQGNSFTA